MSIAQLQDFREWSTKIGITPPAAPAERPAIPRGIVPPLPPIETLAELLKKPLVAPPVLVDGLIHGGTKVSLAGGSKSFKTWTMMDMAASVSAGTPFWGLKTTAGAVLYANFELHEFFMCERFKQLLAAKGASQPANLSLWNLRGHACCAEQIVPKMIEAMRDRNYALVVLDPVYKLMAGADENSPSDIGGVLNELEKIAVETGAAVVFGAHFSKGNQAGKDVLDRVSGSGVFARDPDSIITLTKHAEEGAFVVEPVLRNFPPMKPFTLRWEHPLMHRADDLDPSDLRQSRRIRATSKTVPTLDEFVGIFPDAVARTSLLTAAEVSAEFVKRGWDKGTVVKLREEAIQAGVLRKFRGPHNRFQIGRPDVIAGIDAGLDQLASTP